MKNLKLLISLAAAAALVLTSCSKSETEPASGGPTPVRFTSGAAAPVAETRASNDMWSLGDRIGVTMFNSNGPLKSNLEYRAESAGNSTTFTPTGEVLYYPSGGTKVGFRAYYPYDATLTDDSYTISVADQSDPEAIDLLWANADVNYTNKTTTAVPLNFEHVFSKLIINVTAAANLGLPLDGMTVNINNLTTSITVDLSTGRLSRYGNTMTFAPFTVTDGQIYEAIVLPGQYSSMAVDFTVYNSSEDTYETFTWKPGTLTFDAGKKHQWDITVSRTEVSGFEATIEDWKVGAGGSGIAE